MAASPLDIRIPAADRARQALVLVAAALNVGATWLLGATPERTQALSAPLPLDPATWAFGVWGLIYAGLLAFGVYQALPSQAANPRLRAVASPFVLNTLFALTWALGVRVGSAWLAAFAVVGLLVSAGICYQRLGIGRFPAPAAEGWLCRAPFSVYCGWLTVATALSLAGLLHTQLGVPTNALGLPGAFWASAAIAGLGALGTWVSWQRHDLAYALTLVWAFAAIAIRQENVWITATGLTVGTVLASAASWASTWHVEVTRNRLDLVHERLLEGKDAEPEAVLVKHGQPLEPEH